MFSRMWSEVLIALGNGATTTAISVAAAVTAVSVLANVMVISVHALDGSKETDQLDAFGAAIRRPLRPEPTGCGGAPPASTTASRSASGRPSGSWPGGESRAERPSVIADEIVGNARAIHQGTGTLSEAMIPAPWAGDQPITPRPRGNRPSGPCVWSWTRPRRTCPRAVNSPIRSPARVPPPSPDRGRAVISAGGYGVTTRPLPTTVTPPSETTNPRARSCSLSMPSVAPSITTTFLSRIAFSTTA